ncbi:MAG TPA: type I secretion system permease/ATPase, partial [Rhodoferax sp.]|nr:type I secretion system permease/ATPase [Rhodoferax sp.]
MSQNKPASELRQAVSAINPYFKRAGGFSFFATLLILAPSLYMLEVYDRVVNSRSYMTLAMETLLVLAAFVLMEVLEWVTAEILHGASLEFDRKLNGRIFAAIFEANLKRLPGGTAQPMNDFRSLRDFFHAPVVLALMQAPVSLVFLLLIFAISPVLGWTAVAAAVVQTFVGWLNERSTQPPLLAANQSAAAAQQYADGTLRN